MYRALTDEQSFLQQAAAEALARHKTVEAAREALDEPSAYPSLWPVAVEAGWTGLLIGEDADGVGLGAYEALLILEACGSRLADARLLGHLPATALLEAAGADSGLRSALASGDRRAALVCPSAGDRPGAVTATVDGDAAVLDGGVTGVLDADGADVLVVLGRDADGAAVLSVIDTGADGVTVSGKAAYDSTRALADVAFSGARATALTLPADVPATTGRDLQRALLAAESVGAVDGCLTMATEYAKDRVAFGRPIGSYQAIKHKLVEMLRLSEGARSLLVASGNAWGDSDFGLLANAARTAAADALDYSAPENIFIHGGVGATWEHDAMLYYRRAESSRRLAGGADAAAAAVADALLAAA
ncbi:Acyl-CoA dehydrogenase FadE34 [Paraconexibacter sp. AEG42_29]|uniref:Acyl-CoA dehydrogenase FadE34 n=1 Tax=Paraconexibacter sp. AEG42_29 TaxID=2997339 RepID=A0AAU7B1E2_9ACTN